MQRSFVGDHGRPFGTIAALICLIFTVAILVLWDVARDLTGAANPFLADAAQARGYWGVLLASEIVKCVTSGFLLLAIWTLARPIGASGPRGTIALLLGSAGAGLIGITSHWYIEAAAFLGTGQQTGMAAPMVALSSAALVCLGLWAILTAVEARDARSLPGWVQGAGLLTGAAAIVAAFLPHLSWVALSVSLLWWGGIFLTLYKPADRALR